MSKQPQTAESPQPKFSLARLSTAFAKLMTAPAEKKTEPDSSEGEPAAIRVSAKMIVEGMLFVGDSDGKPLTKEFLAGPIRDVTSDEVDVIVAELNADYEAADAAYEISAVKAGYQMRLRDPLSRLRDAFRGEVSETKLTPAALEVLSIVAYQQPISSEQVSQLRGTKSQAILANLVRRNLLSLEAKVSDSASNTRSARQYATTDRFNRLFGVTSPADLPRTSEHADG